MKRLQKFVVLTGLIIAAASCRNDSAPENRIEKIAFLESAKTLSVGDMVTIGLVATPSNARNVDVVSYSVTESGIVEIKAGSGNEGVVIEGIRRGSTIITAKVNGLIDYCSITVLGGGESVVPHITVPEYAMEMEENQRRSIVASLVGGTPVDNSGFVWSYTNQQVISLEATGNIGVFDTLRTGESVITVSHPKAQFSVNVLVYVGGLDEIPVYITTDSNVINLQTTDYNFQYEVSLRGGGSGDYSGFTHKILEGSDVIGLLYNNNIGTISPRARGVAQIAISHVKAAHQLVITVIVSELMEYHYIAVNKTLVLLQEGNIDTVSAEFVGDVSQDVDSQYSYVIEDTSVINIIQSYNNFVVTALKHGKSLLTIKNTYADFDREVLVIVDGVNSVYDNEIYITTNQNVITTQIGADDVILSMQLMGGNEADRNNFIWTVDDGTIIEVESAHGKVHYNSRAMISNIGSQFEAQAVIKAKKVGTATITLENPKSQNTFSVIVKVYAKGTFSAVPAVIGGQSVYKLGVGEKKALELGVVTGSAGNITGIEWKSENSAIVTASGTSLSGVLEGKSKGVTTITVTGNNMKHDYSALVVVGDEAYLGGMPYLYVNNPFASVIKGQSNSFKIICENMSEAEIQGIQVINNNGGIVDVFSYRNGVVVTGLEVGDAELVISSVGLNTVRVIVRVEDYAINPDMPYYLNGDKSIYGVVKGKSIEIAVNLVGGSNANANSIIWNIENGNVADIKANGSTAIVQGKNAGQSVITVRHAKSHNELEIVVYVVDSDSELDNVVIYVKEKNILLNVGEMRYLSITTNANDAQRNGLQWNISNAGVIDYTISSDRLKAYISAREAGSSTITIKYNDATAPAVIYLSVIAGGSGISYINVPSIIEMVSGETLKINAVTSNVSNIFNMDWSVRDDTILTARGNGDTCLVDALRSGNTVISVEHSQSGFKKDIVVYVYAHAAQVGNEYIIAGEQSRYVINKGDIINVGLLFGMKGFPEHELLNIRWTASGNNVVSVSGNGKTATVKGINAGIGTVTASSAIANTAEIEIEVREESARLGQYWFSIDAQDRMKGILCGSYADIGIRVFNGNNEVFNFSGIEYLVEKSDIISVTSNGTTIRVQASNTEGQSYITLRHDLVEEAKILIYTAWSDYALASYYPVMASGHNYLLKKGDSVAITMETKDNDSAKLNNIHYYLENNKNIITVQEKNKKEIVVTANNAGSEVVLVRYNGEIVERIYVSVTEGNYSQASSYLVTESIIGMVVGSEYETAVQTDVAGTLMWRSDDSYIAGIISYSGNKAVIRGNSAGRTVVTVYAGETERVITVVVCETQEELAQLQAINIEQRKFKIRRQDSLSISIQSYQGRVEGETRYGDYYGYSPSYGGVIEIISSENNRLNIWGTAEGIATIRITNSFYNTEILLYIEVFPAAEGETGIVSKDVYISAGKTLYVIGVDERNVPVSVSVGGDSFKGESLWRWEGHDTGIVHVTSEGSYAYLNPVKEGRTEITVSNRECANQLIITVIVGERFDINDAREPYIYLEKNLYETTRNATGIAISYSVMNVSNFNANNVKLVNHGGNIGVTHDISRSLINVSIYDTGIARFDIVYGELSRGVYVLVKDDIDYGNVYLTTSENFVIASIGELRTINIKLVGHDEVNSNNFKWVMESQSGGIELVGNGDTGQIYGRSEGEGVIAVSHEKAPYSLKIHVKIAKDKSKEQLVYLTTARNVIETVNGSDGEYIYVQKVGGSVSGGSYVWSVSDASIVELTSQNGNSARYSAKKAGVAQVTVYHTENSTHKLNIVVIVKNGLNNGVFITTSNTLIVMAPGDVQKRIGVWLENGGTQKDNANFKWSVEQNPFNAGIAKAGGNVISIVPSNEECFINAGYEGTAIIRVDNPGIADMPLHITVYVTRHATLEFSVRSKVIVAGSNELVGINLPTYEYMNNRVRVWSSDVSVCEVYYTSEIVLLNGKKRGNAVITATIDDKESETVELYVSVVEEIDPNTNTIAIEKSLYSLNLKSGSIIINAAVTGANIVEPDNDRIKWSVNNPDVIDIFPASGTGRQIQISPKKTGTAIINVSHDYVEEKYWKQISLVVSELNQTFTLMNANVKIVNSMPETVSCNIAGGTTKDYSEVQWVAAMQRKWDGTLLEVVRVMGSGKEVLLYPINDGATEVYAIWGGNMVSMTVTVESEYYFAFNVGNIFMWPGEIKRLDYTVKPTSSNINWIVNTLSSGSVNETGAIVSHGDVMESGSVRYLRVEGLREGSAQIIGMANGKVAVCTVYVQYDYSFTIGRENKHLTDNSILHGIPAHSMAGSSDDGKSYVEYTLFPPDTYIKAMNAVDGLDIDIQPPDYDDVFRTGTGHGKIIFTGDRELAATIRFKHYRRRASVSSIEEAVTGSVSNTEKNVEVQYYFLNDSVAIVPYFVRGDGVYSNTTNMQQKERYAFYKDNKTRNYGETITPVTTDVFRMNLADGDQHYILLDKQYDNASLTIENVVLTGPVPNGVTAHAITNYMVDGVSQPAISIYGGPDYIKYTRVAFEKELLVDTTTSWYGTAAQKNGVTNTVGFLENGKEKTETDNVSIPRWTSISASSENPLWISTGTQLGSNNVSSTSTSSIPTAGQNNVQKVTVTRTESSPVNWSDPTYMTLYFLPKDNENSTLAKKYSVAAYRVGDSHLIKDSTDEPFDTYKYADFSAYSQYDYFFDPNFSDGFSKGLNKTEYKKFLENQCDEKIVYRQVYRYNRSVYNAHQTEFDKKDNATTKYTVNVTTYYTVTSDVTEGTVDETDSSITASDSYVTSYLRVNGTTNNYQYNKNPTITNVSKGAVKVYIYPKNFVNDSGYIANDYRNKNDGLYYEGTLVGATTAFDSGFIDFRTREKMKSSYEDYTFSTNLYYYNIQDTVSPYSNTVTVTQNAFTKAIVGSSTGAYISLPPVSASYNSGALQAEKRGNDYFEYFELQGLSHDTVYTNTGTKKAVTETPKKIAIGGNKDMKPGQVLVYSWDGKEQRYGDEKTANTESGSIFRFFNNNWESPRTYRISDMVEGTGGSVWGFGNAQADMSMRWVSRNRIILPYYILNSFPFRYEKPGATGINGTPYNIVTLADGGGVPMPSLSKTVDNDRSSKQDAIELHISYKRPAIGNMGAGVTRTITIKITYETRPCHFMYKGSVTDDGETNTGSFEEYSGPVTRFDDLTGNEHEQMRNLGKSSNKQTSEPWFTN